MRIPSGVTDQYIYFMAVDATDYVTPETGLSSFTVRRSRNGGASAAFTTPTINETDSANMPGVYELLLDEDMTLDSGDHSQEVCLRITHAGMAPVTLKYELYRPDVTAGETIGVSSGAVSNVTTTATATAVTTVNGLANNVITAAAAASDFGTEIGTAVWATAARTLTALDEDSTTLDLDATIRGAVGLASANLDTQLGDLPTNSELSSALGTADDAVLAQIALVKAKTDNLPSDPADASDIASAFGTVASALITIDGKIDTLDGVADAIKAKTDSLTFGVAGVLDANIKYVNDVEVDGVGTTGDPWGPAS